MTRNEIELAMIEIGKQIKAMVGEYKPNANHISIDVVNGNISVSACEFDVKINKIKEHILSAMLFADGGLKLNGMYIEPIDTTA